ncbi:MAG TPA: AmmeMemoRadiSam system radical SAM enzyme [bacterium]|nr:AmmeMemoRadiSam system radical SAM enzyme [bacterium]
MMQRETLDKLGAVLFLLAIVGLVVYLIIGRERAYQSAWDPENLVAASYTESLSDGQARCTLCPNNCLLSSGQTGVCRARRNIDGTLYSLVYGKIASRHVDPIEKKPLYHFLPGTNVYSIATAGCNLQCKYCQNWSLSQQNPENVEYVEMTPQEVIDEALASGSESIAFTYNEPSVFFEFMLDTAELAKANQLHTVWVTSGYINQEPLAELIPYLDAANVDLKGMSDEFYLDITSGRLQPVLDTIVALHEAGVHVEITNLVIPGENDSDQMLSDLISWVYNTLGEDVVLHFSRFHPDYQLLNIPPTPVETLEKARQMALDTGLHYVYVGNVGDASMNTTYCRDGSVGIARSQFFVTEDNLNNGVCADGTVISGVWE